VQSSVLIRKNPIFLTIFFLNVLLLELFILHSMLLHSICGEINNNSCTFIAQSQIYTFTCRLWKKNASYWKKLCSHCLVNINSGACTCCTASCSLQFSQLKYSINTVLCPGRCWDSSNGTLCGDVTYGDGPVCLAAQHAGKISSKLMLLASYPGPFCPDWASYFST